jgi:hypothetical protein
MSGYLDIETWEVRLRPRPYTEIRLIDTGGRFGLCPMVNWAADPTGTARLEDSPIGQILAGVRP